MNNHSYLRNVSNPLNITMEFKIQDELLYKSSELVAFGLIFLCFFVIIHNGKKIIKKLCITLKQPQFNQKNYKNVPLQEEINKIVIDYYNDEYKEMPYKRKSLNSPALSTTKMQKEYFPLENVV